MPRRRFLGTAALASASLGLNLRQASALTSPGVSSHALPAEPKPALLGGNPVRTEAFPHWPVTDSEDREALLQVFGSGRWSRSYGGSVASEFETAYAERMGARHCIAVANGTSALFASLAALGVGPGDEVILPPYTFVATLNVILLQHALPLFVDVDAETFQIDAGKVEPAITERTAALIPVHIGGAAADLDAVLSAAARHRLPVVEDACQAHLGEWRGRKVGTLGDAGCFSFQASKNLNCGEGGAILTNDAALAEKCYAFHNNCRPRPSASYDGRYLGSRGANLRLTDFQAALLLSQMRRLEEQSRVREENAAYLTRLLEEIPGVRPARLHAGCTRNAWHLYMFRYNPEAFAGLSRQGFLRALHAEGIPCSGGYSPLNRESFVLATLKTRAYQRMYPPELLSGWEERNHCPVNDLLCKEAVWFTQTQLLGPRSDMDQMAAAIRKIRAASGSLREGRQMQ
jgi:perosamine synthetase